MADIDNGTFARKAVMNPYRRYRDYKLTNRRPSHLPGLLFRIALPLIGLLALIWFLVRVIPKPSRAAYPCQRIAFPLASGFIVWLMGIVGALAFLKRARRHLNSRQICLGLACFAGAALIFWTTLSVTSAPPTQAGEPVPNQPIGVARGIFPGRVVWVHDPDATDWDGIGDGHPWQPEHTNQPSVDAMVSRAIRELTGQPDEAGAWDALFRHFNTKHGKGDTGYSPGEKITIKINLTTTNSGSYMNTATYDKIDGSDHWLDKSDTSPQVTLAVIRQLVYRAGVDPAGIAVGDTLCHYPNQWRDPIYHEFPEVIFFDARGEMGRTLSTPSSIRQYWSGPDAGGVTAYDTIPQLYADADYLINLPVLKGHAAGITLCAKNHYGSYNRRPTDAGYYPLHNSIAGDGYNPDPAQYRAMVDITGHPHMGGKTLLYLIDGLYGGYYWRGTPRRFEQPLFGNDWPSSILASQDPVAIDSVGLDILWNEWSLGDGDFVVRVPGVDDYLIEAALADDPPSGTVYDPDGDGVPLGSLGVHERWNNSTDRQYSRNLGTGNGIELRYVRIQHRPADLNNDTMVDVLDLMELANDWLWTGPPGGIPEDLVPDGTVNLSDFKDLSENWSD